MPSYSIRKQIREICALTRILLARPNNANVMIRELEMRRWYFSLWHVTRRAVFVCNRTTLFNTGFRSLISEGMTLQTSLVVISRIFPERLMRVVTRNAAYISIVRVTLALKNTIRLETNVVDVQTL